MLSVRHGAFIPRGGLFFLGLLLAIMLACAQAHAAPQDLSDRLYELQGDGPDAPRVEVEQLRPTGGRFLFVSEFDIRVAGDYVLDFKNSSVIGQFTHRVFDADGHEIAHASGGLENNTPNPLFLRHGRLLRLAPGQYRLETEVASPFFLAQPSPYLDTFSHYSQAIKRGNALTLICLGIFLGLGIYYAALATVRRRPTDALYATFILGNLLYNGSALLVFHELFGLRWFYLISAPILLSNLAYVAFVMTLLDIRRATHPRLFRIGCTILGVMAVLAATALFLPNWSLEFDRWGVGLFLFYGFSCGVYRSFQGSVSARLYLVANVACLIPALAAISLLGIDGVFTMYVEHLGLFAICVEVTLLALVLAYQFGQLHRERLVALREAEAALRLARTDQLTGLPNRYALEEALAALPLDGALTFIDLDGLKHYNDRFGHARGDALLRCFGDVLQYTLKEDGTLHRLGGDEFAVIGREANLARVAEAIEETIRATHEMGFEFSGASFGSVSRHESPSHELLKHIADERMYLHKKRRSLRDKE
jgi:diguanylate cyclase (GGDEF)-like protein